MFLKLKNTISDTVKLDVLNNVGIGLDNLKKRLELIYKNNYELSIGRSNYSQENIYSVKLRIQL